jgi:hypothetical protein
MNNSAKNEFRAVVAVLSGTTAAVDAASATLRDKQNSSERPATPDTGLASDEGRDRVAVNLSAVTTSPLASTIASYLAVIARLHLSSQNHPSQGVVI